MKKQDIARRAQEQLTLLAQGHACFCGLHDAGLVELRDLWDERCDESDEKRFGSSTLPAAKCSPGWPMVEGAYITVMEDDR